ncbi:hypothetical protein C4573_05920 [Candidatus Woesearchaeota archaeon]|nr:MAG: hypothetical protein C4573_05920 [Candidatus Woesearchaeota archaeon]
MNITEIEQKENPLFARKAIKAEVRFEGPTPSRIDIAKAIAAKTGAHEDCIVVKKISTAFGKNGTTVYGFIYESAEKKNIESKYMLIRHLPKDKRKEEREKISSAKKAKKKGKKSK